MAQTPTTDFTKASSRITTLCSGLRSRSSPEVVLFATSVPIPHELSHPKNAKYEVVSIRGHDVLCFKSSLLIPS